MNPLIKLQDIYECRPCVKGWRKLLVALGYESCRDAENIAETKGIFDGDKELSLGDIAISNGSADALWCIRVLDWDDVTVRRRVISQVILPAVKRASANTTDVRVAECITAIQQWCDGDDDIDLVAAADASYAAAEAARNTYAAADAAYAAYVAAYAAVYADAYTHATCAVVAAVAAAGDAVANAVAADAPDAVDTTATVAAAEQKQQCQDIIAAFPPVLLSQKDDA